MGKIKINNIYNIDCIEGLKLLDDNSIDSVVCDPPYLLNFMNKEWDRNNISCNIQVWKECLRVLKPGGHLLAFGGTRTYHRMACAIEDAGFEIRDSLAWMYGTGFPKSLNVGKAITALEKHGNSHSSSIRKARMNENYIPTGQEDWQKGMCFQTPQGYNKNNCITELTENAQQWNGFGTSLKPAYEPIVMARKPLLEKTVASNVLKWGTGGINIDGCRIEVNPEIDDMLRETKRQKRNTNTWEDGSGFKNEKNNLTGVKPEGRFPANVILSHSPDCRLVGVKKVKGTKPHPVYSNEEKYNGWGDITHKSGEIINYGDKDGYETVDAWECVDDCPVKIIDEQSGKSKSVKSMRGVGLTNSDIYGYGDLSYDTERGFNDSGGASRFFYTAKASGNERYFYCHECKEAFPKKQQNNHKHNYDSNKHIEFHPTVKPLSLLEYLVKLVTPPNGICLDPFLGTGTTALACKNQGFNFVGFDNNEIYYNIALKRIS